MRVSQAHKAFGIILWPRGFEHFRIGALNRFAVCRRLVQAQHFVILLVARHDLKYVHAVNIVEEIGDFLARQFDVRVILLG